MPYLLWSCIVYSYLFILNQRSRPCLISNIYLWQNGQFQFHKLEKKIYKILLWKSMINSWKMTSLSYNILNRVIAKVYCTSAIKLWMKIPYDTVHADRLNMNFDYAASIDLIFFPVSPKNDLGYNNFTSSCILMSKFSIFVCLSFSVSLILFNCMRFWVQCYKMCISIWAEKGYSIM